MLMLLGKPDEDSLFAFRDAEKTKIIEALEKQKKKLLDDIAEEIQEKQIFRYQGAIQTLDNLIFYIKNANNIIEKLKQNKPAKKGGKNQYPY